MILAALVRHTEDSGVRSLLVEAERFVFLVSRAAKRRADAGDAHFYRRAHDFYCGNASVNELASEIKGRADSLFKPEAFLLAVNDLFDNDGNGFYGWKALRYFLFEYECWLQSKAKASTAKLNWDDFTRSKKDHVTVEHIYPMKDSKPYWRDTFGNLSQAERYVVRHSLGNLLAVALHKNVSLSNDGFFEKKKSPDGATGYFNGSYSEIEVAQEESWTPQSILDRGLRMLDFLERRWRVNLGNPDFKKQLLCLHWLKTTEIDSTGEGTKVSDPVDF